MKLRTRILTTALAALIGAPAASLVAAPAASAAGDPYSQGVRSIDVAATTDACTADQALPCTPGAGLGEANVLRVVQLNVLETGTPKFNRLETTALDHDDIWAAATIAAECRTGYRLLTAKIGPHHEDDAYRSDVPEVVEGWTGVGVSTPVAKAMPTKTIAVPLPIDEVLDGYDSLNPTFPTRASVFAAGEARIAGGMNEATARSIPFEIQTEVRLHAEVRCIGTTFHRVFAKRVPLTIPLTVEYVGRPQPPARGQTHGTGLTTPAGVTQATLSVIPEPGDPCTLHLSGSITSAVATQVTYRFVDQWGELSNGFVVDVAADAATFVDHEVHLAPTFQPSPQGSLATPTGGTTGPVLGEAAAPTSNRTGTYQLRVESPNLVLSNVDGFSVPCA